MCSPLQAGQIFNAAVSIQEGREGKAYHDWMGEQAAADAYAEREAGKVRAGKVRKAGKAAGSEARAGYAASGVDVNSGTAERVQDEITRLSEEEALQQILYGERKAQRFSIEAGNQYAAGRRARAAGYRNAIGSFLGGGSRPQPGWGPPPGGGTGMQGGPGGGMGGVDPW